MWAFGGFLHKNFYKRQANRLITQHSNSGNKRGSEVLNLEKLILYSLAMPYSPILTNPYYSLNLQPSCYEKRIMLTERLDHLENFIATASLWLKKTLACPWL